MKFRFLFSSLFVLFIVSFSFSSAVDPAIIDAVGGQTISVEAHDNWENFGELFSMMHLEKQTIYGAEYWFSDELSDYIQGDSSYKKKNLAIRLNADDKAQNFVIFRQNLSNELNEWKFVITKAKGSTDGFAATITMPDGKMCNKIIDDVGFFRTGKRGVLFDDCGILIEIDYISLSTQADIRVNGFGLTTKKMDELITLHNQKVSQSTLDKLQGLRDTQALAPDAITNIRSVSLGVNDQFISTSVNDNGVTKKIFVSIPNFIFKDVRGLDHLIIFDDELNIVAVIVGNWRGTNNFEVYIPKNDDGLKLKDIKDYDYLMSLINFPNDKLELISSKKIDSYNDFLASWGIGTEIASIMVPVAQTAVMKGAANAAGYSFYQNITTGPLKSKSVSTVSKAISVISPRIPGNVYIRPATKNTLDLMFKTVGSKTTLAEINTYLASSKASSVYGRYIIKTLTKEASKKGATKESIQKAAEQLSKRFVVVNTTKISPVITGGSAAGVLLLSDIPDIETDNVGSLNLGDVGKNNKFNEVSTAGELTNIGVSAASAGVATGISAVISGVAVGTATTVGAAVSVGVIAIGAGVAVPIWYFADSDTYEYSFNEGDSAIYLTKNNNWGALKLEQINLHIDSIDLDFMVDNETDLKNNLCDSVGVGYSNTSLVGYLRLLNAKVICYSLNVD